MYIYIHNTNLVMLLRCFVDVFVKGQHNKFHLLPDSILKLSISPDRGIQRPCRVAQWSVTLPKLAPPQMTAKSRQPAR